MIVASPEAGQALRNNMMELNSWRAQNAGTINGLIGPKQAAQAPDAFFDFETFTIQAGVAPIKPTVIPWPYATDDAGCAFDQANLWGVRFNAYNPEQNAVIAVPRLLPVGYTKPVNRGGWQCAQLPFLVQAPRYHSADGGTTWTNDGDIIGTPVTRYYLRAPASDDQVPKDWGPMNWANKSGPGGAVFGIGSGLSYYGDNGTTAIYLSELEQDHIGFRRVRIHYAASGVAGLVGFQGTVKIGYVPVGTGITYPTVPTSVFSRAINVSDLTPDGPTNSHVDINCTTALAPAIGTRVDWYIWFEYPMGTAAFFYDIETTLSPRTDVPLPFDVVGLGATGMASDWHAPGGYV